MIMYMEEPNNNTICTWCLILDKNSKDMSEMEGDDHFEHFKNVKALPHFGDKNEIFRTKMIERFGIRLWKVLPRTKETMEYWATKIIKIEDDLKNEEDLMNYMNNLAALPMPKEDLQWDLRVHDNYQKDKMVIFGRVHHGAWDGLGTLMMLSSIDGNKNLPAIPQMKDISTSLKLFLFLVSPLCFIHSLYVDQFVKNDEGPYVLKKGYSGKKSLAMSKTYEFGQLR